jgi:hypothetical protein
VVLFNFCISSSCREEHFSNGQEKGRSIIAGALRNRFFERIKFAARILLKGDPKKNKRNPIPAICLTGLVMLH